MTEERRPADERRALAPTPGERMDLAATSPSPPLGLGLELPERGTGARAARRAAEAAAAQRAVVERDVARRLPGLSRWRRVRTDGIDEEAEPAVAAEDVAPRGHGGAGAGTGPSRPRRPTRRWLAWFTVSLLACLAAAVGLTVLGVSTLRESRTGRTVVSAQPDEPGFEGFLEPTPTLAVGVVNDGLLEAAYVLSLGSGDAGGGVLLIPAATRVGNDLGPLDVSYAFGASDDDVRSAIEVIAGVGLDDMVLVDDARWAELVAPVAPIRLSNPDALDGFPAGPVELAPEEVGPFLRARGDGESDTARLVRHELLWEAWLAQLADAGEGAVPGEPGSGLGRFVRGLAAGQHEVRTLPVTEVVAEGGRVEYAFDLEARTALVVELVPFPKGTPYAPRTLVRLLDGTGDLSHVPRVAPRVVASDASIVVVGNADRFDYETTQIRYHQPEQRVAAERLREDLGAGEVIEDVRPIDSFDVTIVLGTDL